MYNAKFRFFETDMTWNKAAGTYEDTYTILWLNYDKKNGHFMTVMTKDKFDLSFTWS